MKFAGSVQDQGGKILGVELHFLVLLGYTSTVIADLLVISPRNTTALATIAMSINSTVNANRRLIMLSYNSRFAMLRIIRKLVNVTFWEIGLPVIEKTHSPNYEVVNFHLERLSSEGQKD